MRRKLTRREKILTGVAGAGGAAYLLMKLILSPLVGEWQETELEITKRLAQYVSTLKVARTSPRIEQSEERGTTGKLSDSARIAEFLREIEAAAGQRVAIRRFQPLRTPLDKSSSKTRKPGMKNIATLQVQIECVGTFQDLMAFFERMETQDALTRVRHLYLTPEGNGKERLQCQFILVRMVIT